MPTKYIPRLLVCLVVIALALPLAVAKSPARLVNTNESTPQPIVFGTNELLVGQLECFADPYGGGTHVSFIPRGTIEVQTGPLSEIIARQLAAVPEDPCPGIRQAATDALGEFGCTSGQTEINILTFVCLDRRERLLQIMARVSAGVLTGQF